MHLPAAVGEARVACWWEGPKTGPRVVIIRNVLFLPLASLPVPQPVPRLGELRDAVSCRVWAIWRRAPPACAAPTAACFAVTMLNAKCRRAQTWGSAGAWRGCSRVLAFGQELARQGYCWDGSNQTRVDQGAIGRRARREAIFEFQETQHF